MELERDVVAYQVKVALQKQMAIWRGSGDDVVERLSTMVTEALFDTAVTSSLETPEKGVLQGLRMLRNWKDE